MSGDNCVRIARVSSLVCCVIMALATGLFAEPTVHSRIAGIVEAEAQYDLFSGTVLVARDGKIIFARGCGEANKEYSVLNTLETRFNIGSIQKTLIGTVTMQLFAEGKLDLDDPITRYYPDCPWEVAGDIRIRNLLNHTSGLEDYRESDEYQMNADSYGSIEDVLPLIYAAGPTKDVNVEFQYSNAGVLLLKGIIEQVAGMNLKQAMHQRIFDPLGMDNTTFMKGGEMLPHRASAYRLSDDATSYLRELHEPSAYSGGGIYTTVLDLLKFDQALYADDLLTGEYRNTMFTPVAPVPFYACGWIVVPFGGTTVVYHNGGSGGFSSEFRRYPEKGYTIIVLSNYPEAASELANKIDCMLFGEPFTVATAAGRDHTRGMQAQGNEFYETAVEFFERNVTGDDPHMPSLYQAARTRIMGEFDQQTALEFLDRYIALADESTEPSIAAAWWRKGVVYEQLGDTDKAVTCHERSLELDDEFENAREALTRLRP